MRSGICRAGVGACAAISIVVGASAAAAPRAPTAAEGAAWQALVVQAEAAQAAGDWKQLERASRKRAALEERTYGPDAPLTAASWS
ncbi:hypothetical protein, partial [Phenylobacterium sp.]|uniref:hypothetical protein n=1 Tax=Phenylobacterium sp. TaxID=1871053 RepID=UPI002ED9EBD5